MARVPLIFCSPSLFPRGKRIDNAVESVSIFPTLIDVLGLKLPADFSIQGKSLYQNKRIQPPSPFAFYYERDNVRFITDERWKFISNSYYRVLGDEIIWAQADQDAPEKCILLFRSNGERIVAPSMKILKESPLFQKSPERYQQVLQELFQQARNKKMQLFDIKSDPNEEVDLIAQYPEMVSVFMTEINKRIEADRDFIRNMPLEIKQQHGISDKVKAQLEVLGYL